MYLDRKNTGRYVNLLEPDGRVTSYRNPVVSSGCLVLTLIATLAIIGLYLSVGGVW